MTYVALVISEFSEFPGWISIHGRIEDELTFPDLGSRRPPEWEQEGRRNQLRGRLGREIDTSKQQNNRKRTSVCHVILRGEH